jgi:Mg2+/Co2+ transporter CorC
MVHQKDLFLMLSNQGNKTLKEIMRTIMFVPETVKVNQMLREFRQEQMHIAIVLNEHGIVTGLITLEDILEEIVGEISDEHEAIAVEKITSLPQGGWMVDASIALDELSQTLGITFETEWSGTLGGFIIERLHHLPQQGEQLEYKKYQFQVYKATPKRVHQVVIFEPKS